MDNRDSNIYFLEDALHHLTHLEADLNLIKSIGLADSKYCLSRIRKNLLDSLRFERLL